MKAPQKNNILFAHIALHVVPGLSLSARRVGAAIIEHFNKQTARCDPSIGRLAKMLNLSRRSVLNATAELCDGVDALFEKRSHGGRSNCASYMPCWDRLSAIVDDWDLRMKDGAAPEKVQKSAPDRCKKLHVDGAEICTQTDRSNRQKKPTAAVSLSEAPGDKPSASQQRSCRKGLGNEAKPNPQRFMIHAVPGGRSISHSEAARNAAERRFSRDLHAARNSEAVTLALMDATAIYDQAIEAELARHGAGLRHALATLNGERKRYG